MDVGSLAAESRLAEYLDGSRRLQLPPDSLSPVTVHKREHPELESATSGGGHVVSFEETQSPHHRCECSTESPSCLEPEKLGHTESWPH